MRFILREHPWPESLRDARSEKLTSSYGARLNKRLPLPWSAAGIIIIDGCAVAESNTTRAFRSQAHVDPI